MLASPIALSGNRTDGPRPINLRKDSGQVLGLLDLAFGPLPGGQGRRILSGNPRADLGFLIGGGIGDYFRGTAPGMVWEENGRIIGTLSLLSSSKPGRYLVANVAVHPEHRRRGIATGLMNATMEYVEKHGGREIMLQVERNNEAALRLYSLLRFKKVGEVNRWESRTGHLRSLRSSIPEGVRFRVLSGSDREAATVLERKCMPADLHWPNPPSPSRFRLGLWRRLGDLLNGRRNNYWAVEPIVERADSPRIVGLVLLESEWARPHELTICVAADWRGTLERALVSFTVRQVKRSRSGRVRLSHLAHDELMNGLLREANFKIRRSLSVMRYTFEG